MKTVLTSVLLFLSLSVFAGKNHKVSQKNTQHPKVQAQKTDAPQQPKEVPFDYGFRNYDSRLGRYMHTDTATNSTPSIAVPPTAADNSQM